MIINKLTGEMVYISYKEYKTIIAYNYNFYLQILALPEKKQKIIIVIITKDNKLDKTIKNGIIKYIF